MNKKHTGNLQDTREYFEKMKEKMNQADGIKIFTSGLSVDTDKQNEDYFKKERQSRITELETIIDGKNSQIRSLYHRIGELVEEGFKAEAAIINAEVKIAKLMARVAELEERCFNETF